MTRPKIGDKVGYHGVTVTVVDFDDKGVVVAWYSLSGEVKEVAVPHGGYQYNAK